MLDIYVAREAYSNRDMDNIALIRTQHNLADALTKICGNSALLLALRTHRIEHPVVQYVLCPKPVPHESPGGVS
jgi:hypothetical protein